MDYYLLLISTFCSYFSYKLTYYLVIRDWLIPRLIPLIEKQILHLLNLYLVAQGQTTSVVTPYKSDVAKVKVSFQGQPYTILLPWTNQPTLPYRVLTDKQEDLTPLPGLSPLVPLDKIDSSLTVRRLDGKTALINHWSELPNLTEKDFAAIVYDPND